MSQGKESLFFEITVDEANHILKALGSLQYNVAAPIIANLMEQAKKQMGPEDGVEEKDQVS